MRSGKGLGIRLGLLLGIVLGVAALPAQGVDVTRYAKLLKMADERRLDSALVLEILAKGTSVERAAAARAVGQVQGGAMAPKLRTLLADRDTAVAANAAFALGLLKDSASVSALARALDAAPGVAGQAAWSLGAIGAPAAAAIDSALVKRPERAASVTVRVLLAASRLHPVPVARVTPWFASPDAHVRWAAVYAIARPYAAAGVRAVLPLAHDPDPETRALVARALSHVAAGDSLRSLALPALDTLARDKSEHVRVNAVRSLGTYGKPAHDAVFAALHDADANVRIVAAQALRTVMVDVRRKGWMDAWKADTSFPFQREVLISALVNDVVLDVADEDNTEGWRHNGDWHHRAAVADAGAAAKNIQRMREVSLPLARDPDPRVRAAAYSAIAPYADSAQEHPWRREFLYLPLTDWDPVVRSIAIGALTDSATAAEAVRVLKGYARSAADSLNDGRVATVIFLRSAWQRDSARFSDPLRAAVRALPVPPDQATRDIARGFALLAAWESAPPLPVHELAWYENVVRTLVVPALGGKSPRATIATVRGSITLELNAVEAPLTVLNFITLARAGYYENVTWHRVVPNFVVQDGDRRGDGNGGPGWSIRDELNRLTYERGALGMALSGPDTGGSQYFITLSPQPHLDAGYTTFGRVVAGSEVLDGIVQYDAISSVRIAE